MSFPRKNPLASFVQRDTARESSLVVLSSLAASEELLFTLFISWWCLLALPSLRSIWLQDHGEGHGFEGRKAGVALANL